MNIISRTLYHGGVMKTFKEKYIKFKYIRYIISILILIFIVSSSVVLSGCGSGGGGTTPPPSSPPPSSSSTSSTSSSSGGFGVFTNSSGETVLASPSGSGGYLTTLPNSGPYTVGATITTAQFTPMNLPIFTTNTVTTQGTNVDAANNIGVAFSFGSKYIPFFYLTGSNAGWQYGDSSSSSTSAIGYYTCGTTSTGSCPSSLSFSGGSPIVGGVVMDSKSEVAIASTYGGYDIINYAPLLASTPSVPTHVMTIPSWAATGGTSSSYGIGMVENFAFDPALTIGGTTYQAILSGGGQEDTSSTDGNMLDVAVFDPVKGTYTIYKPDSATASDISAALHTAGMATIPPYVDQIGIDTAYQVAVLGNEWQGHAILIDLNQLTLTPPSGGPTSTTKTDGTYSLPFVTSSSGTTSTAIVVASTAFGGTTYTGLDNVTVESSNHIAMLASGGYMPPYDVFGAFQLSDPMDSPLKPSSCDGSVTYTNSECLGAVSAPVAVTMPLYNTSYGGASVSDTAMCTYSSCSSTIPSGQWYGWYDPHEIASFPVSLTAGSSISYALWGSASQNFVAVVNITALLANPTTYYNGTSYNAYYQEIP